MHRLVIPRYWFLEPLFSLPGTFVFSSLLEPLLFRVAFGFVGIEFELPSVRLDRMNRTESGDHSVAIYVAANCGPAGMKPAETFLVNSLEKTREAKATG